MFNSTNEELLPEYLKYSNESTDSFNAQMARPNWVNISSLVPLDWAIPLYGYMMPFLVIITTITNCFIVIVLSQKHLRTPTNGVLLAMAITDLMTGLTSIPWFIYYYTLKGYAIDQVYGMDRFSCFAFRYLFDSIPSVLHTTATWLTVFLAVQRYVYVCVPDSVHFYCTPRTTRCAIIMIFFLSFITVLPDLLSKEFSFLRPNQAPNPFQKRMCSYQYYKWVQVIGIPVYHSVYRWVRAVMHFIPCTLLLVFTYKLGKTIKKAEIRKKSFVVCQDGNDRKVSTVSNNGRSLYATNRMLSVICSVFLILEIPASVSFVIHFLVGSSFALADQKIFVSDILNRITIIRNLLIVLTSPIQFTIYCSMSEQFRLTVRQLFTSKLLFVAQAQATFHGGKRYSLILVDVETIEAKKNGGNKKNSRAVVSVEHRDPSKKSEYPETLAEEKRKGGRVGRQVSFKDRPFVKHREYKDKTIVLNGNSDKNSLKKESPLVYRRLSTVIQEPPESPDTKTTCVLSDRASLLSEPTLSSNLSSERTNGEPVEMKSIQVGLKDCIKNDDGSEQIDI
ncbi:unnamed protein product, partial [Mesorhabditis belari]|uniref:G-protein coupled receptors family 1 profile domain-containing protein n=1 Tax=Mesorhabditis belari TaxID=2138241 RepID=A0AAF3FL49_9BILA